MRSVFMEGISYWIEKRAYISPNRTALVGETRRLTYHQMAIEINAIFNAFTRDYHVRKGDRIAILSGNNIEYFLLLFAIAKIGCIAVPLNIRLSSKELEFQLKDSEASVLITNEEFYETGKDLASNCSISHLIKLEDLSYSNIQETTDTSSFSTESQSTDINGSAPFLIVYTSGTTGRPKGAVLTQENMYWNAINNILSLDLTSYDRILSVLPLFHIGGIGLFALPALLSGGTVIIPNKFDPEQTLRLVEEEEISVMMGVPTIFDALRKSKNFLTTNLKSIKWFYSGGASCPHELINFYLEQGFPFGQGYGMTETSPTVFMLLKEDYRDKVGSIGKAVLFVDIRIVNEEGLDVEDNQVGELIFKGPNVFKEYWNLPYEIQKSFKDGWFYSGDLAKRDKDGFIYIAGRKKDMIISGGENIYPLEVEQVIGQHSLIAEAAVIGIPNDKWGEVPIAIVSVKAGQTLDKQELIDFCTSRLAKYKIPKAIEIVSALPMNATGKIDKASLTHKYQNLKR